jgi:hypothetical protein
MAVCADAWRRGVERPFRKKATACVLVRRWSRSRPEYLRVVGSARIARIVLQATAAMLCRPTR